MVLVATLKCITINYKSGHKSLIICTYSYQLLSTADTTNGSE